MSEEDLEQRFRRQYDWYVERYGFGDEKGLASFLEERETVLEAGTGPRWRRHPLCPPLLRPGRRDRPQRGVVSPRSEQITELGRELSRTGATIALERGVPLLGIEPGDHDVQRLIYWSFLKCFWNENFSERLNVLVNFHWYHPPYASRHTEEEVRG